MILAITLTGLIASVDSAGKAMEHLRHAAIAAGCPEKDVRVSMRWQGGKLPVEISVWCEEGK